MGICKVERRETILMVSATDWVDDKIGRHTLLMKLAGQEGQFLIIRATIVGELLGRNVAQVV
jgi:hypothetical protein